MSVYTAVERNQLEDFLSRYDVGKLITYQGISAGIVNTNYFVTTSESEYVLTLFEQLTAAELPYFLEITVYLAHHGISSAPPIANKEGSYLEELNGKPAALVKRLKGKEVKLPTLIQCQAVGHSLGCFHLVSPNFPLYRSNHRGPQWWRNTAERVLPFLNAEDRALLQEEMNFQLNHKRLNLPRGVIHADLFRDNVLFEGDELSGIIDFYYACNDVLIYDVAITVNDWCSLPDGSLDASRVHTILESYRRQREFTTLENKSWIVMLRAAALRFWLSRLLDLHFPRPAEITHTKNPDEFKNILKFHISAELRHAHPVLQFVD